MLFKFTHIKGLKFHRSASIKKHCFDKWLFYREWRTMTAGETIHSHSIKFRLRTWGSNWNCMFSMIQSRSRSNHQLSFAACCFLHSNPGDEQKSTSGWWIWHRRSFLQFTKRTPRDFVHRWPLPLLLAIVIIIANTQGWGIHTQLRRCFAFFFFFFFFMSSVHAVFFRLSFSVAVSNFS